MIDTVLVCVLIVIVFLLAVAEQGKRAGRGE